MKKQNGFTLIELMIVVAIIGIIAGIAYPSYQRYMTESRRSDAHVALLRMADAQERFYLQNNMYTATVGNVGGSGTENNWYELAVTAANANAFTLTADSTTVPGGSPQANDVGPPDCTVITLTSAGQKTPAACW